MAAEDERRTQVGAALVAARSVVYLRAVGTVATDRCGYRRRSCCRRSLPPFRPIGRRYADPAGFLMPAERWQADRDELAVTFGRTLDADERLLEAEQQHALRRLQDAVDAGDGVRLVEGRLELSRPDALEENPSAVRLRTELDRLTPRIDIPDLLAEVQGWTAFTDQLTHVAGANPRMADLQQSIYTQRCSLGV